jgi:hypothetical protein
MLQFGFTNAQRILIMLEVCLQYDSSLVIFGELGLFISMLLGNVESILMRFGDNWSG